MAFLLLPCGAALLALTLIFPKIGFLEWIAAFPALLFLFGKKSPEKRAFGRYYAYGFLFFYTFYLVVFHWFFALYPMDFAGVEKSTALFLVVFFWLGLSLLQAVVAAFVFPLFHLLSTTRLVRRVPLLTPAVFAALYAVFEWLQTLTFAGVPWGRLSLGQSACGVLLNGAAIAGSYLITFSVLCVGGYVAFAVLHLDRVKIAAVCALSIFRLNVALGGIGYAAAQPKGKESVKVAAVQGNLGSSRKWESDSRAKSLEIYERYTAEAAARGAAVVVFPETFIPEIFSAETPLGKYIVRLAVTYCVTVVCGAFEDTGEAQANAVFAVFPDGTVSETVYRKRHLVPFGEYVPLRGLVETLIPPLADVGMLDDDLVAGESSAVIETPAGKMGTLICFDSIYESLTRDSARDGAEFFVLPTNDSWFLDSAAATMHLSQARLRAVESGRPIVRAADTGISAVIAADGSVSSVVPALTEGMSMGEITPTTARTPYTVCGNWLIAFFLIFLLSLPAHTLLCRRRERD